MNEFWLNNYQLIISVIITIIGFFITYLGINKSFKNEVSKMKQEVAIRSIQEVPYQICTLIHGIIANKSNNSNDMALFEDIIHNIISYGSEDAVKITVWITKRHHSSCGDVNLDEVLLLSGYSLLIAQIKFDLTSELISPETFLVIQANDYSKYEISIKKEINKIVKELNLDKRLMI